MEDDPIERYMQETNFPAFEDGDHLPDRATGIVHAAVLDDRLTVTIKSYLREGSTLADELFGERGRVGEFGTKIDLGYLLGIYERWERRALHAVREIRNKFAHLPGPVSFEDEAVSKFMAELAFADVLVRQDSEHMLRGRFLSATTYLLGMLIARHRNHRAAFDALHKQPTASPDKPAPPSILTAHPENPPQTEQDAPRGSSQE